MFYRSHFRSMAHVDKIISVLKYVDWLRNSVIHISMTIGCTADQG